MYSALVGFLVRQFFAQLNRGRVTLLLPLFSPDATFLFPGDSSWSGRRTGRVEIGQWLERFADVGLFLEVQDVLVAGPPWNLRIAVRYRDHKVESGSVVYDNEGMLYERVRWGRITHHESHEDTVRVAAFDEFMGHSSTGQDSTT